MGGLYAILHATEKANAPGDEVSVKNDCKYIRLWVKPLIGYNYCWDDANEEMRKIRYCSFWLIVLFGN